MSAQTVQQSAIQKTMVALQSMAVCVPRHVMEHTHPVWVMVRSGRVRVLNVQTMCTIATVTKDFLRLIKAQNHVPVSRILSP